MGSPLVFSLRPTFGQQGPSWWAWPSGRRPRWRRCTGSEPSSPSSASSSSCRRQSCPSCPSIHRLPSTLPPSGSPSPSKLAPSGPSLHVVASHAHHAHQSTVCLPLCLHLGLPVHPSLLHLGHLLFSGWFHQLLHHGHHHGCLLLRWWPHHLSHHLVHHLLGFRAGHELLDHLFHLSAGHELHRHVLQLSARKHLLDLLLGHVHGHLLHDVGSA